RPERVPGHAVALGEAQDGGEVALEEHLAGVAPAVHAGEALVRVGGRAAPAERAHELRIEVGQGGDLRRAAAEATVERHDRVIVRGEAQRVRLVEQLLPEEVRAGGGGRYGDRDEQAGVFLLEDLRGAQLVGDRSRVLDLRLFQVEVEGVQPVAGDHLLVGGGGGRRRAAHLAQLGAVEAAGGHDHVPASGADLADDRADLGVGGHRVGAVPRGGATAAVGQDEGHVEGLLPGGGHHLADAGSVAVQRAVVGGGFVPVDR